jgi:hypothetical protein
MALPDRIFAQASPKSIGGRSLFDTSKGPVNSFSVGAFSSPPNLTTAASARLQQAGFEVLQATALTINFAGPPDLFQSLFRADLVEKEVARPNGPTTTYLDSPKTDVLGLVPPRRRSSRM